MVYVLDGVYKISRKDIDNQLSALLEYVTIEDSDVMKNSLQFYADTKLDFVDCILLSYFKTNNIQVATFDKKLKNKMKYVKPGTPRNAPQSPYKKKHFKNNSHSWYNKDK